MPLESEAPHTGGQAAGSPTHEKAITDALNIDAGQLLAFEAGDAAHLRVRVELDRVIGQVVTRDGFRAATQVVVRLMRDDHGIYIVTAYPELPR